MKKLIFLLFIALNLNAFSQQYYADFSFNIGSGFDGDVYTTTIQPNGMIIVGGGFYSFNGIPRNKIARLNTDGSLDTTFNPGSGFDYYVYSSSIQSDGKIVVVGDFLTFNGIARSRIARLNTDGSLDTTFNPGSGFDGFVQSFSIQSDGKIIVGGDFSLFNGYSRGSIARLNTDGSLDTTFNPGSGFEQFYPVNSIEIQSDGKIIVGGNFYSFNGNIIGGGITRLNTDGSLDTTFNPGSGFDGYAYSSSIQSDGKIIVGGDFSSFNGISRGRITRLNTDGSLDTTFNPGSGFDYYVSSSLIQTDGKIVVGGNFLSYNGILRNRIARINIDGSIDNTFNPGFGFNDFVSSSNLQPDGEIIIGGSFTNFNGSQNNRIARIKYCGEMSSQYSNTICDGEIYFWNNIAYSEPGIYQQTLTNQYGCDSVVTLNLTVLPNNFNPTFSSANQLFTSPPFAVQFTNSTANAANYSFTWDFGDGTTLASNNASVFHQYSFNGQYTVSLIATSNTTGCSDTITLSDYIFCTGGVSCTHTAAISQTSPQQVCQGTTLWLSCNSDPSFSYQWRRNGVTIPGNNNDSLQVSQSGTYSVIISVNNCPITSGDVVVTIFSAPSTPIITSSGTIQPCVGGSVTLNSGVYTTYNWSNGATTQNINVSSSGAYSVSVTNANGCSSTSAPFNVNASFIAPPQVCIVGMDSLTNENRIVWEKPLTLGIDSFYVYKESNVSNVYTKIGATDYNQLAVFLDANSNPAVQAYRYKISALDTCGTESNVGDFHKTIHLTINQGVGNSWNLIWSHYEGITFGSYNIYRGTSLSNMSLLTTIQSNLNSYTDLTPPTGPLFYQIEVVNPNNCDPTKIMNYSLSRSNIVNNGLIGISEEVLSTINVYPNPTNDKFTLNVSNDLIGKGYVITDFSGRIISQGKINALIQTIDIQEISKGAYFLQIEKSSLKAFKIIKQ